MNERLAAMVWHMFSCGGSIFDFRKEKEKKKEERVGTCRRIDDSIPIITTSIINIYNYALGASFFF